MWRPLSGILFILEYLMDLSGSGTPRMFYDDVPRDRSDMEPLSESQPELSRRPLRYSRHVVLPNDELCFFPWGSASRWNDAPVFVSSVVSLMIQ